MGSFCLVMSLLPRPSFGERRKWGQEYGYLSDRLSHCDQGSSTSRIRQHGSLWASGKHSHTAHVSGTAKIYYPHHPNCGQAVTLVRRCASFGPGLVQVELPLGDQLLVADWMLDEHSCYGMDVVAEPRLDIAALLELRELVDLHLSRPENAVASEASSTGGASREPTPSGRSSLDDPIEAGTSPREPTALP